MGNWYVQSGPESDVVISTRVRVARNLKGYPFPCRMNAGQRKELQDVVRDAVVTNGNTLPEKIFFVDVQNLSPVERLAMVEKHLISPELAEEREVNGALISHDEKISIMLNEEDHLRIQCMFPGMQMDEAWQLCDRTDSLIESRLEYAFDARLGYLTACPTNLGTGIRASVMMHLPALALSGYMKGVLQACSKLGIAVRGLYGENSEATGNMFQVSNQVTLGQSEQEILENVTNIVSQIAEQERVMRSEIHGQNPLRFEDRIYRSLGVFSQARIMTTEECFKLMSDVRLGLDMGIIKDITRETLNEIMVMIQPANLQKIAGKLLNAEERDAFRAEVIRTKLQ